MRVPIGLVFVRETRRSSRRLRSMLMRSLLTLFPMVLVVTVSITVRTNDLSQSGGAGIELFGSFSGMLIAFALIVPPIAGAMGVHAEREEGTLDLLRLTHLNLRRVLDGVISARLAGVLLALAGAAPALALITTLGGVSPSQVAYLVGSVLAIAVYVGWTSALLASTMRGVVGPVFVTWGSLLTMLSTICCFGCVGTASSAALGAAPPSPEPVSFVIGLLLTPVPGILWSRWIAADALERAMYGAIGDTDDLSWRRRVGARRGAAIVLLLSAIASAPLVIFLSTIGLGRWFWLVPLASTCLVMATFQVFTIELAAGLSLVRRRTREHDPDLDWRALPHRRLMRKLRGRIVGNPVAWRETMTRGAGSLLPFVLLAVLTWSIAVAIGVTAIGGLVSGNLGMAKVLSTFMAAIVLMLLFVAPLLLPLTASASWTPERRLGTAAMLLQTTLGSSRFMWGKLLAHTSRVVPTALGGSVLICMAVLLKDLPEDPASTIAQLTIATGAILFWLVALGGICHLIAARMRPTRAVWMVGG
ncbi:MAG: hypothetical protein ACI9MC_000313, partial [Kiritimatiellia bacterium]